MNIGATTYLRNNTKYRQRNGNFLYVFSIADWKTKVHIAHDNGRRKRHSIPLTITGCDIITTEKANNTIVDKLISEML